MFETISCLDLTLLCLFNLFCIFLHPCYLQYDIGSHKDLTKNLIQIVINTINVQNHECSDEYAQKVGRSLSGVDEEDVQQFPPPSSARRGTLAAIFGSSGVGSSVIMSPSESESTNGTKRRGGLN